MRAGHRQAYYADMAQLVERTLGKGEVPSSILGISTMHYPPCTARGFLFEYMEYVKIFL